jgi:hypothetical protein
MDQVHHHDYRVSGYYVDALLQVSGGVINGLDFTHSTECSENTVESRSIVFQGSGENKR